MPDEAYWESLFDVPLILDRLAIDSAVRDVVELGCGYGTFTLQVARRISGTLFTFDLEPEMVLRTRQRLREAGIINVVVHQRDVEEAGYSLPEESVDGALLFNILHGENPVDVLKKTATLVRPGGWLWAIHWRYDPTTPRGPSMSIRPRPGQIARWAESTRILLRESGPIDLPPWHYGWRFRRV